MAKFTKMQSKARKGAAFMKGVFGVTGALNKVASHVASLPREISGGDVSGIVGLANAVGDARTALSGMSIGSG